MRREVVDKVERKNFDGYYYEVDEYGHIGLLEHTFDANRTTKHVLATTDPLGDGEHYLAYGGEEDGEETDDVTVIVCEFVIQEAHVAIHCAIDSDHGGVCRDYQYEVVRWDQAVDVAEGIEEDIRDYFAQNWPDSDRKWWDEQIGLACAIENQLSRLEDPTQI